MELLRRLSRRSSDELESIRSRSHRDDGLTPRVLAPPRGRVSKTLARGASIGIPTDAYGPWYDSHRAELVMAGARPEGRRIGRGEPTADVLRYRGAGRDRWARALARESDRPTIGTTRASARESRRLAQIAAGPSERLIDQRCISGLGDVLSDEVVPRPTPSMRTGRHSRGRRRRSGSPRAPSRST